MRQTYSEGLMSLPPKPIYNKRFPSAGSLRRAVPDCTVRMSPAFADEAMTCALERSNEQFIPAPLILDVHFSRDASPVLGGLSAILAQLDSDRRISRIRCSFGAATGPEPLKWLRSLLEMFSACELTRRAPLVVQAPFALLNQARVQELRHLNIRELQLSCHDAIDAGRLLWQRNLSRIRTAVDTVSFGVRPSIPMVSLSRLLCAKPDGLYLSAHVLAAPWLRQQLWLPAPAEELQAIYDLSACPYLNADYAYVGFGGYRRRSSMTSSPSGNNAGPVDVICLAPGGLIRIGEWVFRVMPGLAAPTQLVAGGACLSSDLLAREEQATAISQRIPRILSHAETEPNPVASIGPAQTDAIVALETKASSLFPLRDRQLFAGRHRA